MKNLGLVVYSWGPRNQDRLIVECLGPAVRELIEAGLASRFWFDRFDARGPHVLFLVSLEDDHFQAARERLAEQVEAYLSAHPSEEVLTPEDLADRHAGCRGKVQCEADARPGFGANNSFVLFEHGPRDYPFWLSAGVAEEERIWSLLSDLAFWAIDQLAARPGRVPFEAAVRWSAELDRALRAAGLEPAGYWRYHATTLILGLDERLETKEEEVLASLPGSVGEKNLSAFERIWSESANVWPSVSTLVHLVFQGDRKAARQWALLREIVHGLFKQLSLPVRLHIPVVLFGWHQNVAEKGREHPGQPEPATAL
jgi:hypothetical protein